MSGEPATAAGRALICVGLGDASTDRRDVLAIEVEAAAAERERILRELRMREQDLLWCNKDDDCHSHAYGVTLAISDITGLDPVPAPSD
jgi:hypothetical protein